MKSDFDRWLDYHSTAYPGMLKWLADKTNKGQVDHMRRLLEPYSIDDLSAATDALYGAEDQPRGYSEHARAIRRLVNPKQESKSSADDGPKVVDGHLVASCPRCMDYGVVEVLSQKTIHALRSSDECPRHPVLGTCILACSCNRGRGKAQSCKLSTWQDGHNLIRYEDVLDEACNRHREFDSLQEAMWHVAQRLVGDTNRARHVHEDFQEYAL